MKSTRKNIDREIAKNLIDFAERVEPGVIKKNNKQGRVDSYRRAIVANIILMNTTVTHQIFANLTNCERSSITTLIQRYDTYKAQWEMYGEKKLLDFEILMRRHFERLKIIA